MSAADHDAEVAALRQELARIWADRSRGGKKGARTNAEKARKWKHPAEVFARRIRAERPWTSTDTLAESIITEVPGAKGRKTVVTLILQHLERLELDPLLSSPSHPIERTKVKLREQSGEGVNELVDFRELNC